MLDPQMMQILQQMRTPPQGQPNIPQLSSGAAGAMLPPQGAPMGQGGFLGAAQAQPPMGAMPPAGDSPPAGIPPRLPPPGSGEPDGSPIASMPGMPAGMTPDIMQNMMMQMSPQAKQMVIQQLTASLAASGRGGDTTIAHLTPGEITVPPQVQNKKVLATLNKAFKDKGAAAHQFTVGSPTQSVNPQTGLPEYSFLSSPFMKTALPIALGIGGSLLLPGIGTALGASMGAAGAGTAAAGAGAADAALASGAAGAGTAVGSAATAAAPSLALQSIGSGLGTTAGGLITGQKPTQAIMSGIGSGVGGYTMGNISNGMTAMGNATGSPASSGGLFGDAKAAVAPNVPWAGNSVASPIGNINPYQMMGSAGGGAAGGFLGSALAKKPQQGPQLPPGFNTPYSPGQGSWQDMLGQNTYNGPRPDFTGYNPATNFPSAHNFYPTRA